MSDKNNTVQAKITALNELVAWFQSEEFTLEAAVTKFETAEKLAEEIEQDLQKLKNDITVVKQRFDREAA
jgi:exodeoxyribonuclease VII small subunit